MSRSRLRVILACVLELVLSGCLSDLTPAVPQATLAGSEISEGAFYPAESNQIDFDGKPPLLLLYEGEYCFSFGLVGLSLCVHDAEPKPGRIYKIDQQGSIRENPAKGRGYINDLRYGPYVNDEPYYRGTFKFSSIPDEPCYDSGYQVEAAEIEIDLVEAAGKRLKGRAVSATHGQCMDN